eukprot:6212241-Pleurochrysis_carterae.AAC.2
MAGRPDPVAHLRATALLSVSRVRTTESRQMGQLGSDPGRSEQRGVFLCRCTQGALGERDTSTTV